jgi:hypothetical protein
MYYDKSAASRKLYRHLTPRAAISHTVSTWARADHNGQGPGMAKRKSNQAALPRVEAVVLCDSVVNDPGTGKQTLYGTFDNLTLPAIPNTVSFFSYIALFGGKGEHDFTVDLLDPSGKSVLGEAALTMKLKCGPSLRLKMGARFQVTLKRYGKYSIEVRAGSKKLTSHPTIINVIKTSGPDGSKK